ncbi:hypothetical protein RR46_09319 [Papilio xuthus]|uniref:Cuticular protein n=1 Tax=Papilio xuthus TaxID=66420 RepID=A0A194PVQ8_PAPXU|nr:hypothetical protein RR46_09319 [Papilio xuthus]
MFGKLVILFAIVAFAFARPQVYPGYSYGTYSGASYPGYYGYSGYSNPYSYGSYGSYAASPYSSLGYGYY